MDEILRLLQTYEVWVYIVLGAIGLVYFQKTLSSWGEWRRSMFGLERHSAQTQAVAAMTILALVTLMMIGEFVLVSFVVPAVPQSAGMATATVDLLATPTVTLQSLNAATPADDGSVLAFETVTPTPLPLTEGCVDGQIAWTSPKPGDEVSGTVKLTGVVNVPNLGFYKYEYAQPDSDIWNSIAAGNQPIVVDSTIGFWQTSTLIPGDYLLRLVVMDNENNYFPACVVSVRVAAAQ